MSIQRIGSDLVRPLDPVGARSTDRKKDTKDTGDASARSGRRDRTDRVGLSPEGLALAAKAQDTETNLTPERIADIKAKIADGFYNKPEVAGDVARRVLASGDV